MGWMYVYKPKTMSIREFFEERFNYSEENGRYGKILDCAVVNLRTAYIAYEIGDAQGKREVIAIVCALDYNPKSDCNFGYKDMDETMGPYLYDCPERILKLLTPTDHEYAKKWREKCWENIRKRKDRPMLKKDAVIEFSSPIHFRGGWKESVFTVIDPRRLIFRSRGGTMCRIRRSTIQHGDWKIIQPE